MYVADKNYREQEHIFGVKEAVLLGCSASNGTQGEPKKILQVKISCFRIGTSLEVKKYFEPRPENMTLVPLRGF